VTDRFDAVLRRAPFVVAAGTILSLLVAWDGGHAALTNAGSHGWLDWVAVGYAAYGTLAALLLPRMLARRETGAWLLGLRYAFAVGPFLGGLCAWTLGAHEWAALVALGVSIALLLVLANDIGRTRDGRAPTPPP
jgi:hypothetical protein